MNYWYSVNQAMLCVFVPVQIIILKCAEFFGYFTFITFIQSPILILGLQINFATLKPQGNYLGYCNFFEGKGFGNHWP